MLAIWAKHTKNRAPARKHVTHVQTYI